MKSEQFTVVLEYQTVWPDTASLHIEAHITQEITIAPEVARRRAAGFLGVEVLMAAQAGPPTLVIAERPIWRVPAHLQLPGLGDVATLGTLDIDAATGDVIPLTPDSLADMQRRAHAIATRLTSPTTPTS